MRTELTVKELKEELDKFPDYFIVRVRDVEAGCGSSEAPGDDNYSGLEIVIPGEGILEEAGFIYIDIEGGDEPLKPTEVLHKGTRHPIMGWLF